MPRADIVAAIKKRGYSLEGLSRKHGLSKTAVSVCLCKPWPHVEQLVAATIGVEVHKIWPSRYDRTGLPIKRGRKAKSSGPNRGATQLYTRETQLNTRQTRRTNGRVEKAA